MNKACTFKTKNAFFTSSAASVHQPLLEQLHNLIPTMTTTCSVRGMTV